MNRRELLALTIAAALSPLAARAQQKTVPLIGLLSSRGADDNPELLAAIRRGLANTGFVEGQNVAVEYRFAENQNYRLPALAADLVQHRVNVITTLTTPAAFAAKAATTTIPIVFEGGTDPVQLGLVTSLSRPGGNITGVTHLTNEIAPKRLEFLHELVPAATAMGLLANPNNPAIDESETDTVRSAADALGLTLHVLNAGSERDFEEAFLEVKRVGAGGLVINADPFFTARQEQLATLALRHAMPAAYSNREFVTAGGLLSYGGGNIDAYRLAGTYIGRILKGEKPGELPVQQATKVELYLNLKTAKTLGVTVPPSLRARADEVIE